jgi:tetratricopeptide (TPR) repeat protein
MRSSRHTQAPGWGGPTLAACVLALLCGVGPLRAADATTANARASQRQAGRDELARARAAYRARPDDPEPALRLGLLLYRKDRLSLEAQRLLNLASHRWPQRYEAHLALLDSYLARKNSTAATALLTRLQRALDSSTRFAFDATYCLLQHEQIALAKAQWQRIDERTRSRAAAAKQEVAEAAFVRGLLATAAGNKEDALQSFHRADGQDFPPLDSPQMLMLADCFFLLKEYKLAGATYQEALKHFPENTQARWRFGLSLYWTSQLNETVREFEKLVRQNPSQPEVNLYLGSALFALRLNDRARACFERELELDPRCDECMSKLAHLAYLAGDDRQATSWLDKASALSSSSPETDLVYGMIANRAGKYEAAIQYLSRVVEQAPRDAQAQFQLAIAYQRSGDIQKAQEHVDRYRQLNATEPLPQAGPPAETAGK